MGFLPQQHGRNPITILIKAAILHHLSMCKYKLLKYNKIVCCEDPNYININMQLYTIVTKPQSMDVNTVIANFCNNLDREVKEIPYFKWKDVNTVQASLLH